MNADVLAQALRLSPSDRLDLIEALWDTLSEGDIPVTPDECAILDARRHWSRPRMGDKFASA